MPEPVLGQNASREELLMQLEALWTGETDATALLANTASLLYWARHEQGWHWIGFYRVKSDGTMTLGPFHGPPACMHIAAGQGVCGACVQRNEAIYVPDVHAFPGHIACSALSRSEYVAPIRHHDHIAWILDLDSDRPDGISGNERDMLSQITLRLGQILTP